MKKLRWIMMVVIVLFVMQGAMAQGSSSEEGAIMLTSTDLNSIDQDNGQILLSDLLSTLEQHFDVTFLYKDEVMINKFVNREEIEIGEKTGREISRILDQLGITFRQIDEQTYVLLSKDLSAQVQEEISGTVTDSQSGETLPGVNVLVKGTSTGTSTDQNGSFELTVESLQDTLVISFVGYQTQEVPINSRTEIDVALQSETITGQEMVVVGYGTQEARDVTGSVSQVDAEEMEQVPAANFEEALKGRISGVQVTQNSGEPGGRTQVRIRGGNSMIGNNDPLYVVDGFPVTGGIDHLNPSDIESMDVLKDASSTAIYGARGANGVVLVTTKSGSQNQEARVSLHSYYGMQSEANRVDVLNAEQYAIVANEYLRNEGQEPFFEIDRTAGTVTDGHGNVSSLEGTNWQDQAISSAPVQKHAISFSGGGEQTTYSLSFNYFDQEGIVHNSFSRRGNVRLNLNHELNEKLDLAANLNVGRSDRNSVPVNNQNLHEQLGMSPPPTLPVYNEEGLPTRLQQSYFFGSEDMEHPAYIDEPRKDRTFSNSILGNASLEYEIIDGLAFKSMFGLEYEAAQNEEFVPMIYDDDRGTASENNSFSNSFLTENTLSYDLTLSDNHRFDMVGGITYQSYRNRYVGVSVEELSTNTTENFDLGSAGIQDPASNGISEWKLLSGLARVNYAFDDKYLVTVSMRSDGSSRFGEDNKWGFFPSAALGWRISNEPFMADVDFIDDLKIRASYGVTGNTALSPYQSLSSMSSPRTVYGNNSDVISFVPDNIANPALQWETTAQSDIGLELSTFEGILDFTFDYYEKETSNLLASVPLPTSSGYNFVLRNVGTIENKGVELSVNANVLRGEFQWDISGHYSNNNNVVKELAGGSDILSSGLGNPFGSAGANIAREGEPFGAFYGYEEDGVTAENGQRVIVDQNDDGVINASDRVVLGSPHPDFNVGLNNEFFFKNFSLDIFLNGVFGNDIFWAGGAPHMNSFQRGHNQIADVFGNYWTEEDPDPNSKYPKVSSETYVEVSDELLFDASYLRVKTITLTYDIPATVSWFERAQVYISGDNLFTFTDYPGVDPGVNTYGTDSQNVGDRLQMGVAGSTYPPAKTVTIGTKLNF